MGSIALQNDVVLIMVPFPLHGHLNQLLHLSRLISASSSDLPIHFVAAAADIIQSRRRIHGYAGDTNPLLPSITFHDVPSPPPIPDSPDFHPISSSSAAALRRTVAALLRRLSATSRRVVVVYDSLMGSVVQDLDHHPNAEAYTFHSVSAYTIFFFLWENLGRPVPIDPVTLQDLPPLDGCFSPEFADFIGKQHEYLRLSSGRIYNTSRVIEARFLDFLSMPEITGGAKQFALGPFNPIEPDSGPNQNHPVLQWLDRRPPRSTILVSFGTTTTMPPEQVVEIAAGLERSEIAFVWLLRSADHRKMNEIRLPVGFEDRVKGRGKVIRDWAPQLGILGHKAIGGFVSHCGWNSCMESISMGIPIAAWPVNFDQPRNAALVTAMLGVGLAVRRRGLVSDVVAAEVVESAVRRLMASEEGGRLRQRAAELGAAVRTAAKVKGGEMDAFVAHINRRGSVI